MPNNMGNGETGEGGWYYINNILTSIFLIDKNYKEKSIIFVL
jgi:hypothetical protein